MVVAPDLDVLKSLDCADNGVLTNRLLVSPTNLAYEQINRWHPNLVVVVMRFEDLASYQLLTMLAVNPDTRQIPIALEVISDHDEDAASDGWGMHCADVAMEVAN